MTTSVFGRSLQARGEAGGKLVELCESHVEELWARSAAIDRDGSFPVEAFRSMGASGVLAGPVPERLGGLGVSALADLTIAVSRLARGCASTALSANMHLLGTWSISRFAELASHAQPGSEEAVEMMIRALASGDLIVSLAGTERGVPFGDMRTTARREGDGWVVDGRKIFATNSEAAGVILGYVRVAGPEGDRLGTCTAFLGTPGLEVSRTWDALGMRATGSHDLVFNGCRLPLSAVRPGPPMGEIDGPLLANLLGINLPILGVYLGLAERARAIAVDLAQRPYGGGCRSDLPGARQLVSEIEVDLHSIRGAVARAADLADDYLAARPPWDVEVGALDELVAEWQCAKLIVSRAARSVVENAMSVVGGASFSAGHPLSRLWRDVKAAPFHQPCSPVEGPEFIARSTLGLPTWSETYEQIGSSSP